MSLLIFASGVATGALLPSLIGWLLHLSEPGRKSQLQRVLDEGLADIDEERRRRRRSLRSLPPQPQPDPRQSHARHRD